MPTIGVEFNFYVSNKLTNCFFSAHKQNGLRETDTDSRKANFVQVGFASLFEKQLCPSWFCLPFENGSTPQGKNFLQKAANSFVVE